MSKNNSISLRMVMQLPADQRYMFIKVNYPSLNIDLVSSIVNGFTKLK